MDIDSLIRKSVQLEASDLHLAPGAKPKARISGLLMNLEDSHILQEDIDNVMERILTRDEKISLSEIGVIECSYSSLYGRCRVNFFKVRRGFSAAIRIVGTNIPSLEQLGLPVITEEFCSLNRGLVIVTGPTGSGKSTTLASLIDRINNTREAHIITLEEPMEFIHQHKKCIINQRDISKHSKGFSSALQAALRQNPDIILVGNMTDTETIKTAILAAEAGHLVLCEMNTLSATNAIERIIDKFPLHHQAQIRLQLSMVIEGIISQRLLPRGDGLGLEAVYEVMQVTTSIRSLISEGKTQMIQNQIQIGSESELKTMDGAILELYENKKITKKTALDFIEDREAIQKELTTNKNYA